MQHQDSDPSVPFSVLFSFLFSDLFSDPPDEEAAEEDEDKEGSCGISAKLLKSCVDQLTRRIPGVL